MPFILQNTVSSEETDNFKQEVSSHFESEAHHALEKWKNPLSPDDINWVQFWQNPISKFSSELPL